MQEQNQWKGISRCHKRIQNKCYIYNNYTNNSNNNNNNHHSKFLVIKIRKSAIDAREPIFILFSCLVYIFMPKQAFAMTILVIRIHEKATESAFEYFVAYATTKQQIFVNDFYLLQRASSEFFLRLAIYVSSLVRYRFCCFL